MPRVSRQSYISSFLHIMVQGINKEDIFKKEFYKNLYLKLLRKMSEAFDIIILAYVIMDNHVHILIYYNDVQDISKFMHQVNQNFAQIYNKNNERVGHVFRDRYKCKQIKYITNLYMVLAYIHFNPYKAGIVNRLIDYKFSSYNQYLTGKIDRKNIYYLFQTYDYKFLFEEIHKEYFAKFLNNKKTYKDIIEDFKVKNEVEKLQNINKDKKLLKSLILELKCKTNLSEKQICEILKIGKNRITKLKKEGFGDASP